MTYLNTFVKTTKQKEETFMLQDIKILKNSADFLDITSLNTFIKNTIICQNYMAVIDIKKEEKVMLQISRY